MNLLTKKTKKILLLALLAGSLFNTSEVFANPTPVGLWKTINEETNEAKSYVHITEQDGVLTGKIEKILNIKTLFSPSMKLKTIIKIKLPK